MSDPNAVQKWQVRLCFSIKGALVWLGHLDMMRTMERSLRRAELPLFYSQGFNPRPELVFALPAGVGIETERDYVDIFLREHVSITNFLDRLAKTVPPNLTLLDAHLVVDEKKSIMGRVCAADYGLYFPKAASFGTLIWEAQAMQVEKHSKKKSRIIDLRPMLLEVYDSEDSNALEIKVKAGSAENMRMDLLSQVLVDQFGASEDNVNNARIVRHDLYFLPVKTNKG
ncbi:MAG: TIGR03936 family radical SAM-associated protein [Fastidiosipilaceae bacterium]|jgi:radical SAM-linked protein|nr:DUF2344 domain-containing protein [Clostridiaceae bacterium]